MPIFEGLEKTPLKCLFDVSSITSSWSSVGTVSNSMANGFSIIRMRSSALSKSLKLTWNCLCRWVSTQTAKSVGNSSSFLRVKLLQVGKWKIFLYIRCFMNKVNFNLTALMWEYKSDINESAPWSFKFNSLRNWVISTRKASF